MTLEIIYEKDDSGNILWNWRNDAEAMHKAGLVVRTKPSENASVLLYRGNAVDEISFPKDLRYVQSFEEYLDHLLIRNWYSIIEDITIPTFFVDDLDNFALSLIKDKGWRKAFVKNSIKSLYDVDPELSVWPNTSFSKMKKMFEDFPPIAPGFCIRKYLPPSFFKNEKRYWIMGPNIHHSCGKIPEVVREAASRLSVLKGVFYTIDATPELIIEVGPGESCDRKTDNKAEDFALWIQKAFSPL